MHQQLLWIHESSHLYYLKQSVIVLADDIIGILEEYETVDEVSTHSSEDLQGCQVIRQVQLM